MSVEVEEGEAGGGIRSEEECDECEEGIVGEVGGGELWEERESRRKKEE